MTVTLLYSQGTRRAGPMQPSNIAIGSGTSGSASTVAACVIPGDSNSNPHASAFTITSTNSFASAGVAVGDLVEGNFIKPNTYVLTIAGPAVVGGQTIYTLTVTRLPDNSNNADITNQTLSFFKTPGGSATVTYPKRSGFNLIAGSNLTITESATTGSQVPTYTFASTASGSGDVAAGSNFGTDNVLIKSDGDSGKDVQATGITIADTTNNMSGVGTISSGAITATGTSTFGTAIEPDADDGATLGSANKNWSDLFLADEAVINFGDDQDVTLTHVADTGILLSSTDQLQFGDSGTYIHQSADGVLDLVSDSEIELTAPTLDIDSLTEVNIDTPSLVITSSTTDKPDVVIKTTNDGAQGPSLAFALDTSNDAAVNDVAGTISFNADDAGNNQTEYGRIQVKANAVTGGSESGLMSFGVATSGSGQYADVLTITGGASALASTVLVKGNLQVDGTTTTVNSTTVTIDDLTFNFAADVTSSSALTGAGIVLGAANYAGGSSFSANPTLLYNHTGSQWEFSAHEVKLKSTTASSSATTGALIVAGGAGIAGDLYVGDELRLRSNSSVFAMGLDADDFSITHDGDTGATIAGSPITITAAEASTWSTSTGALTITSAAACTWSAAAGDLTLDSAAGTANLDGHTGVQITSSDSGNIDLDSVADIVLDPGDDKHIFFQEAGTTHSAIGHGTVEITNLADNVGSAQTIDTFDCTTYQAVKYLIVVEDVTNDNYMTTEILMLGDENGGSAANAFMTIYAVLYNSTELGIFGKSTSGNNVSLTYTPTDINGANSHRVRVVANRIASLSDSGQ